MKVFLFSFAAFKLQLLIVAILLSFSLHSQLKPLQIGDTLPNIQLTNLINYKFSSAQLSDFKKNSSNTPLGDRGRVILLDFWATWCGSCYKRFPHLDSLQNEFSNSLTIILVNTVSTHDDSAKIRSFFAKRKNSNGVSYQFRNIIDDSILNNLFPHVLLPHYVWIYNNRYLAATGPDDVSASNIKTLLNNIPVQWRIKNDSLQFEKRKSLINK